MKILSGVPVSQIPFEEVKTGALVVNLKTARQVKIDIPYEIPETPKKFTNNGLHGRQVPAEDMLYLDKFNNPVLSDTKYLLG